MALPPEAADAGSNHNQSIRYQVTHHNQLFLLNIIINNESFMPSLIMSIRMKKFHTHTGKKTIVCRIFYKWKEIEEATYTTC